MQELIRLVGASTAVFADTLAATVSHLDEAALTRNGTAFSWE